MLQNKVAVLRRKNGQLWTSIKSYITAYTSTDQLAPRRYQYLQTTMFVTRFCEAVFRTDHNRCNNLSKINHTSWSFCLNPLIFPNPRYQNVHPPRQKNVHHKNNDRSIASTKLRKIYANRFCPNYMYSVLFWGIWTVKSSDLCTGKMFGVILHINLVLHKIDVIRTIISVENVLPYSRLCDLLN